MKNVAIYGTGGHGREISNIVSNIPGYEILAFIDDIISNQSENNKQVNEVNVVRIEELKKNDPNCLIAVAIGNSVIRRQLVDKTKKLGFSNIRVIDSSVKISKYTTIGEGAVIFPGCILTVNIKIGDFVHINSGCTISHDVIISDFATICPGVNVCGNVIIGENVFIGAGTTIINGTPSQPLKIEKDCIIGAGSCVTKSLETPGTYVGVPARLIKNHCL